MSGFDDLLPKVDMPSGDQSEQVASGEEAKAEETQVEKTEETTEQAEVKSEEKKEDKTEQTTKTEEVKDNPFSFDSFRAYSKEKFETEIESEEGLKTIFEKSKRVDELDSEIKSKTDKITQLEALASKGLNGLDWFANEDEFIRQQVLKKKSGELSESALSILSNLSPKKIETLNPLQAIEINMLMENPDLSKEEVTALIEADYGDLEGGLENMDAAARAKLKINATSSKKSLGALFEGIEIPKAVNFEEQLATRKENWETPVKDITDGIDKLQLTEDFAFDIKDDMKDGLSSELLSYALQSGADINEESGKQLAGMARSLLLERNIDKIMKAYGDDIREKAREEIRKEVHNDKPLNEDKRSGDGSDDGIVSPKDFLEKFS